MSELRVTMIDCGWGDSILLELEENGQVHYGLIDANIEHAGPSPAIFLRKFFEKRGVNLKYDKPVFDFVALTHGHSDHGKGLETILRRYGTRQFWYPKSASNTSQANLIRFARLARNRKHVVHHQAIDRTKVLPNFGSAKMEVLWPYYDQISSNENNNSIVLLLLLGNVHFLLTGDAEGPVWDQIATSIPTTTTKFVKVPHHGAWDATVPSHGHTPWLDRVPGDVKLGISSHVEPHPHPSPKVIQEFRNRNLEYHRTDEEYHLLFATDGQDVWAKYSH